MDLDQALKTTGAIREFSDQPVPDEMVHHILDTARFAPSGGNRQAWHVVVVKDPEIRVRLRDLYLRGWYEYLAMAGAGLVPWAPATDRAAERAALANSERIAAEAASGGGGFAEHLDETPVMLVVLANLHGLAAVDRDLDRYTLVGGASIYPFVWSILLAAHEAGLGGVVTTMMVRSEDEVIAALGVPPDWAVVATLLLGYPSGRRATRLRRQPVKEFATIDGFSGPPLTG
jgi:nitroreductase